MIRSFGEKVRDRHAAGMWCGVDNCNECARTGAKAPGLDRVELESGKELVSLRSEVEGLRRGFEARGREVERITAIWSDRVAEVLELKEAVAEYQELASRFLGQRDELRSAICEYARLLVTVTMSVGQVSDELLDLVCSAALDALHAMAHQD